MTFLKSLAVVIFLAFNFISQSQQGFWRKAEENTFNKARSPRHIIPDKYLTFNFEFDNFISFLESGSRNESRSFIFETPLPDGTFAVFNVVETPVFDASLSSRYPGYYSFTGAGEGQSDMWLKMSVSPFGIHIMVHTEKDGFSFIDPYQLHNTTEYISYYKRDFRKKSGAFSCGIAKDDFLKHDVVFGKETNSLNSGDRFAGDCTLRTYRLAISCTGEYASFHGGTIAKVLAAYNTTMTRVNGVYEKDAAITMKLIADTDKLIFLNQSTDPFTNGNGDAMLNQNQQAIDSRIGLSNYDIGHVFSTGGGGIASLRSPCTNNKAKGVTGSATPVGDPFDIDYVAHEMGHQFGANHTQNNNCNRNSSTAIEPGSGSTIMGYAGICSPDVQNNSDGHFHGISISEIANFVVAGNGNSCPVKTVIDNQKPEVSVKKSSYTIPLSTAFYLTALGQDADGDNLTYCWEQINNETASMPPKPTNVNGPSFRSNPPSSSPTRYFPDLQRRYNTWEVLPSVARTMNFRCTVRDNNVKGGCTDEVNVAVEFTNQAGPFVVTAPNTTSVNWLVGSKQSVTWNVANTNMSPVSCNKVNIYLSIDGGISYPHLLASDVDNTGSFEIDVPALPTTKAKVMVAAADNIFFDVSNANFKITTTFTVSAENIYVDICDQNVFETLVSLDKVQEISQPISLTILSGPQNLGYTFSTNPVVSVPSKSLLSITGLQNLTAGLYVVKVLATSGNEQLETTISLFAGSKTPLVPALFTPADLSGNIGYEKASFTWEKIDGVKDYTVELSISPDFSSAHQTYTTAVNQLELNLQENTIYYWRVRGNSPCVENNFSQVFTFRTSGASDGQALLLRNDVLLLEAGATAVIDKDKLDVYGQNPRFIGFTITSLPAYGILKNESKIMNTGSVFTLEDVIQSKVQYIHNGNTEEVDSFRFNILDDQNRWLPENTFKIKIKQLTLGIAAFAQNLFVCHGETNGMITAEAYGGAPPYFYSLDNTEFQSTSVFADLSPGRYTIYVKDNNGEIGLSNLVDIEESDEINLLLQLDNYNISANATGGSGLLYFSKDDQIYVNDNIFTDPGNGDYTIYVRDERGCKTSGDISINIDPLKVSAVVTNDIFCATLKATVEANASGGLLPYTYSVNGQIFQNNPVFQVNAGNHAVTVKDAGGKLLVSDSISTSSPDLIEITIKQEKLKITVNAKGGTGSLIYSRDAINYTPDNIFIFSDNGSYKLYVRDENLCVRSVNISLNVLKDVSETITNVSCFNKNNGNIKLQATNGTFPFQYSLNNSEFSGVREWTGLPAGVYTYAVKDNKNDTITGEIILTQPDSLTLDWTLDGDDLLLIAGGGIPPYQYSIDGGIVYLDVNFYEDLPSDTYRLSVKDKNNCIISGEAIITGTSDEDEYTDILVSPNPVSDMAILLVPDMSDEYKVMVYSVAGDLLQLGQTKIGRSIFLDVSALHSGVYFVVVSSSSVKVTKKMIKY